MALANGAERFEEEIKGKTRQICKNPVCIYITQQGITQQDQM